MMICQFPLPIDTDPGIDDATAISIAPHPQFDVKMISHEW